MEFTLHNGYRVEVQFDLCRCTMVLRFERFDLLHKQVDDAGNVECEYFGFESLGRSSIQAELPEGTPKRNYPDPIVEHHDMEQANLRSWLEARLARHFSRSFTAEQLAEPVYLARVRAMAEERANELIRAVKQRENELTAEGIYGPGISITTHKGMLVIGLG